MGAPRKARPTNSKRMKIVSVVGLLTPSKDPKKINDEIAGGGGQLWLSSTLILCTL
jgi:hypothetical protein